MTTVVSFFTVIYQPKIWKFLETALRACRNVYVPYRRLR